MNLLHLTVCALVIYCSAFWTPSQGKAQPPPLAGAAPAQPAITDKLLTRRNFYVVFDGSGSMNESRCAGFSTKIKVAKKAVKEFERCLKPEDNIALIVFDGRGVAERVPLGHDNRARFEQEIDAVEANQSTPLYQSIGLAFEGLKRQMTRQLNYGEYHLVVVTDGEATDSEGGVIERINRTPVILHTIGFCIGPGHSLNQPGKTYYADAQNPEAVKKGLQGVLAESARFGN